MSILSWVIICWVCALIGFIVGYMLCATLLMSRERDYDDSMRRQMEYDGYDFEEPKTSN